MLHKTLDLTFRAVIPEKITRMLQEKSDENVIDRGESNEEKGIIKKMIISVTPRKNLLIRKVVRVIQRKMPQMLTTLLEDIVSVNEEK
jgi:hypothetical protein